MHGKGTTSMNNAPSRRLSTLLLALLFALASPFVRADQWTAPTPEELSMTSQPQVPGAAAVYLFYEETSVDNLHTFSVYARVKVLTEAGKDRANVEIHYARWREGAHFTVDGVEGRTIHSDGAIVPFTGKPYEKLLEKNQGVKVMAKVFTLPDVQVGSILEYRYNIRYDDDYYVSPKWYIQTDLYTRKAHYVWKPATHDMVNKRGDLINTIAWFPILPADAKLQRTELPPNNFNPPQQIYELNVHDIPPAPHDVYMPPITSLTFRVLFYYTNYRTGNEFWTKEGKYWSKDRDKFIGPDHGVTAAVQQIVAPSDTPDQKLRKIYAAIMQMENTSYTREHSVQEDKASGLREVHNAEDILERKRGNDDQLTELFVAMARAAGMKAYVAVVTNRDQNLFVKNFLSFGQFDDYVAIVNVNGKDEYFDPGSRYCPYGHLEWKHTGVGGIRQTDGGTDFVETPGDPYTYSRTQRIGDLMMDEHGVVTGGIKMTYFGAPALAWRHQSLTGDSTSLEHDLRTSVENLLPQGMDVKLVSIDHLADYEQPLSVNFTVKGAIGQATGKRLFLPADIFESNAKQMLTSEKRDIAVYFHYPYMMQDAVRIKYPAGFTIESSPAEDKVRFKDLVAYTVSSALAPGSITFRRNYSLGAIIFLTAEYPELRDFFSKMETKDQENIVLTTTAAPKSAPAAN